jgi:hypothetical protein
MVTTAFLLSADCGFYSSAAVMIACTSYLLFNGKRRLLDACIMFAVACGSFLVFALIVNRWAGSWLDFHFWKAAYAITNDYRWLEPFPFSIIHRLPLHILMAVCAVAFVAAGVRIARIKDADRGARLLAFALLSLTALQTSVVRSQGEEVMSGLIPLLIFSMVLLFDRHMLSFEARGIPFVVVAATAASVCFGAAWVLRPSKYTLRPPEYMAACSSTDESFSQLCGSRDVMGRFVNAVKYLEHRSTSNDWVAAFPWDNIYAAAAGRRVAGGVLQNYLAGGDYLTKTQLAGLRRATLAFYTLDGMYGFNLDTVSNFSRSPLIWLYLQANFVKDADISDGLLALRRDASRTSRWQMMTLPIPNVEKSSSIRSRESIPILIHPVLANVDFLRLRLQLRYPLWWKALKPSRNDVIISYADGSTKSYAVNIPPNQEYDLWLYLWDERQLANYFGEHESSWHSAEPEPRVNRIEMRFDPFDHFSVMPSRLTIEQIEQVRLTLR